MRIIGLAVFILIISYIIKIDLLDGTISLAAFSKTEPECVKQEQYEIFPVQTVKGDTVLSVFGVYPSEVWVSFPERLEAFYQENPHLQNQVFQPGEIVNVPIYKDSTLSCS
jgi:hypothetical protein